MTRSLNVLLAAALTLTTACGGTEQTSSDVGDAGVTRTGTADYPAPRFPSYLKATSVDDLMPAARLFVRSNSGFQGKGMGVLEAGESVLIVPTLGADPQVMEAIERALAERNVKVHIKYTYDMAGVSREDAERVENDVPDRSPDQGYFAASQWIEGQFPRPEEPKAWLKERNPTLYDTLFPKNRERTPALEPVREKLDGENVAVGIKAYLTANPEVRGVFWGGGGSTGLRRLLYPMQDKFLGTFTTDTRYDLLSQMASYPGDIWQLAEEQALEPIVYVSRIEITDPEGANLWSDITPEMAERWAQGSYQRGHLYMFPNQATGRFGYSFVDYPAFGKRWLAREPIAQINGVLGGTGTGGAYWPRWEIHYKDGFITEVKGGGAHGEAFREFLQYPGLNNLTYPFHTKPGYWYLYEIAWGTHPKAFRAPVGTLDAEGAGVERARSGVIHWGQGIRLWHDPDAPTESKQWKDFTVKHNVAKDHGWHTYTHFTTYRVRLRNTDRWLALLEKGRLTSLDDPEVRALASRYGDPNLLLAEDWIPEVPGINASGDYLTDYAPDPFKYVRGVSERIVNGTYQFFYPVVVPPTTSGTGTR